MLVRDVSSPAPTLGPQADLNNLRLVRSEPPL